MKNHSALRSSCRGLRSGCESLMPLVWGHVSPYGAFDLDMEQRLDLDVLAAA
jgi:hypothetical protein